MRLRCAGYQVSQKQQLLGQKGVWAAAGGWQPGLVLTMPPSLSGAAGWLGMLTGPRGDQFVHSPQAREDGTFPVLREEAQQGHDQDWGTACWQVPGLEKRAQSTAWCSTSRIGRLLLLPCLLTALPLTQPKAHSPQPAQD